MLKELFYTYQKDLKNENKFYLLTKKLTPKILSIFKTINCSYDLKDDFIQECYFKIYTIATKNEYFFENDYAIDSYFERAFKTVRQQFIKKYSLDKKIIELDQENKNNSYLIETIIDEKEESMRKINEKLEYIKEILTDKEYEIFIMILNPNESKNRSLTEVAKLLNVSPQAIHKRFKKIKEKINSLFL